MLHHVQRQWCELAIILLNRTPVNLDLQRMEKELEKLEEVWGLVFQWEESWDKYKTQTFWEMETDEMEENVMFLFRYLRNKLLNNPKLFELLKLFISNRFLTRVPTETLTVFHDS